MLKPLDFFKGDREPSKGLEQESDKVGLMP